MLVKIQVFGFYVMFVVKICVLCEGLVSVVCKYVVIFLVQVVGGMFGFYFVEWVFGSYVEVMCCNKESFNYFFYVMLEQGVYFVLLVFEVGFVFIVYSDVDIVVILVVVDQVFVGMKQVFMWVNKNGICGCCFYWFV